MCVSVYLLLCCGGCLLGLRCLLLGCGGCGGLGCCLLLLLLPLLQELLNLLHLERVSHHLSTYQSRQDR